MDADGSHLVEDIPALVAPIREGEADHVSASRLLGGSSELHGGFDEFFRLERQLVHHRLHQPAVRRPPERQPERVPCHPDRRPPQQLHLSENPTTIEQEMIIRTLKAGYRMVERPSHEYRRQHGRSHINVIRSAPRYVWCLLRHLSDMIAGIVDPP